MVILQQVSAHTPLSPLASYTSDLVGWLSSCHPNHLSLSYTVGCPLQSYLLGNPYVHFKTQLTTFPDPCRLVWDLLPLTPTGVPLFTDSSHWEEMINSPTSQNPRHSRVWMWKVCVAGVGEVA